MIRVLFIHQNLPGQFRRLTRYWQTRPDYEIVAIGEETEVKREPPGPKPRVIGYAKPEGPGDKTHRDLRLVEGCVRRGQAVARVYVALKGDCYEPDVVVCHPGWGEVLLVEDMFPRARLVVLSWSMRKTMAVGVPVPGSDTAPVRDAALLADRAPDLIARCHEIAPVGLEGRATALRRYDVDTVDLPVNLDPLKPLAAAVPAPAYAKEVA